MANIRVRSTDGLDTDDGSTWTLAKATVTGASAIDAPGDFIFLSQSHAESTSGSNLTFAFAGTPANPVKVWCVNDSEDNPTAEASGATITTTGGRSLAINGSVCIRGVRFNIGTGATGAGIQLFQTNNVEVMSFEYCGLAMYGTSSPQLSIGLTGATAHKHLEWRGVTVRLGTPNPRINVNTTFVWRGGAFEAGSGTPTGGLFYTVGGVGMTATVEAVDMSALASTLNLVDAATYRNTFVFSGCKLPLGWTGSLVSGAIVAPGVRVSMYNSDSGDTNYRMWIEDYSGSIKSETTNVRAGGATDGTTAIAWRMSSNANANECVAPLQSDEMAVWVDQVGVSKTVEIEVLTDGVTLTNAEMWAEVSYSGNAGSPLGSVASSRRSNALAAGSANPASAATWNTTGLSAPVKQKLAVTFTPQQKGPVFIRVCLAKPSAVVFVCPRPTVF